LQTEKPGHQGGTQPAERKPIAWEAETHIDGGGTVDPKLLVFGPAEMEHVAGEQAARRAAEDGQRHAEAALERGIKSAMAAAYELGQRQAEPAAAPPRVEAPPVGSSGVGARKSAKEPRRPSPATQAAVQAIAHFMYDKAMSPTMDPSLLAEEIMNNAVKHGLLGAELLTPRSVTVLVIAAQAGIRRARETD
jgi:hypothetical protein